MLIGDGRADLPLPGKGATLDRWRALAHVAGQDLALVKLFEGHTDALAIMAELAAPPIPAHSRWGTWCAEPPQARVAIEGDPARGWRLIGTKAWCSGAAAVTHAVVSCWDSLGAPRLAAVAMDPATTAIIDSGWKALGMRGTKTRDVHFQGTAASWVSEPHAYVQRAGFWHGSAGIAACWWGAAAAIGATGARHGAKTSDPYVIAHLGAIDVALAKTAALLQTSARWIDAHPEECAKEVALRVRIAVEDAAVDVMEHVGRAVGAGPLCRDERLAQAMTDLPVFLRQSHAERDLAALGSELLKTAHCPARWSL